MTQAEAHAEPRPDRPRLLDLPDEIILHILYHVPPRDSLLRVSRVCKRLKRSAEEPLLWRYHCRHDFRYWDAKHNMAQRLEARVGVEDWRQLYTRRLVVDLKTTQALNGILASQVRRIEKYEALDQYGYDIKDTLLRHCNTDVSAPDVLARRFYANAVLDRLHRAQALEEWRRLTLGEPVSLERALGAFDLFVLHDQRGDLPEISAILDEMASRLLLERPDFESLTTRQKSLATVQFLRANNYTGISEESAYRDLQNNYIGIALQDLEHPSLPLISVAIFCCLAQRVGLDARSCAFPNHVHAVVYAPPDTTLDGEIRKEGKEEPDDDCMYLDPFGSEHEVPAQSLKNQLGSWGVSPPDYARFLEASTTSNIVLRTSRNILATVHDYRGNGNRDAAGLSRPPRVILYANPFADMDHAFYSALWSNFILSSSRSELTNQRNFVPMLVERFEQLYPMDASFIERYVCPTFSTEFLAERDELIETIRAVRRGDSMPKQTHTRIASDITDRVKYRVGQVFRHRRYNYSAVITGWDVECGMNTQWIQLNGVDALERGRHQSFYHALVEDTSIRYVAEDNIEIIQPDMPEQLMNLAGRYFKRWDAASHTFVSNIRDEYPDD